MTFYRHFCERDDFSVQVHTLPSRVIDYQLPYKPIQISLPALWNRFKNTRFHRFTETMELLWGGLFLSIESIQNAQRFSPNAIFTVGGCFDWTSLAARKLSQKLSVPLIASFNDWFDYPWYTGLSIAKAVVEERFRSFYRSADLALCTSEGMKEALGHHNNAHVWYPSGALIDERSNPPIKSDSNSKFRVFFCGSLGEWYGPMLENLVYAANSLNSNIEFKIFGNLQTWSASFEQYARDRGIFRGAIPFDELQVEATNADLLLLPMGFGESAAHIEKTSFKTKYLDYLSFRKPILVWGPEYCSAVRVSREFDSAEVVADSNPAICAERIDKLSTNSERLQSLIGNSLKMYQDRFHPSKIHQLLVDQVSNLLTQNIHAS